MVASLAHDGFYILFVHLDAVGWRSSRRSSLARQGMGWHFATLGLAPAAANHFFCSIIPGVPPRWTSFTL